MVHRPTCSNACASGGPLRDGFEQRSASTDQLRLDNANEIFRWTANVQIISKVYLRRKDQPRTYTLNKKDERMVKGALKKKK